MQKFYTTKNVFPITKKVELIGKKKFAVVVFDLEHKAFIVHIATFSVNLGDKVHFSRKAHLKIDKALIKVLSKYADFANIFLLKLAIEFFKYTIINHYTIKLIDNQQSLYSLIYSLGPVKLETLKVYIKNNLAIRFIKFSKSLTRALIFFDKKPNRNLILYIDYQSFNNLTIKNWYFLLFIRELLD